MSWRMDSSAGAAIWDTEPMSVQDLKCRDEELEWLIRDGRSSWQLINGRIAGSGHPTAALGSYGGLLAYPPVEAQTSTAVTTASPGTTLWTVATYSPILANAIMAASAYRITASGTIQTSTTSQTCNWMPSIGTGSVNAAPTTNQTLGVTGAVAIATTALTSNFDFEFDFTVRKTGASGLVYGMGSIICGLNAAPVTTTVTGLMGGTQATVDFTGATANYPGGFQLSSWAASTVTFVVNTVTMVGWN